MPSTDRWPDLARQIRKLRADVAELRRAMPSATNAAGFLDPAITIVSGGSASIPSGGSGAFLSFTTEVVDTIGGFDPATPTRITIQRDGVYVVSASASQEPGDVVDEPRTLEIQLVPIGGGGVPTPSLTTPTLTSVGWEGTASTVAPLVEGDYVQLKCSQLNAAGNAHEATNGRLSVVWLGVGN